MKKISLCTICLLFSFYTFSQKGFEEGTIITLEGDTISGLVKDRKEGFTIELYNRIHFKPEGKLFKKKYAASKIKGYTMGNSTFESVDGANINSGSKILSTNFSGDLFLKVVLKGEGATYYQLEWVEQGTSMLESADFIKKSSSNMIIRSSQGVFGIKKKSVAGYFIECTPLREKIYNRELKTSYEVVEFYNNWIKLNPQ